jgi:hypothetical protein
MWGPRVGSQRCDSPAFAWGQALIVSGEEMQRTWMRSNVRARGKPSEIGRPDFTNFSICDASGDPAFENQIFSSIERDLHDANGNRRYA